MLLFHSWGEDILKANQEHSLAMSGDALFINQHCKELQFQM